MAAAETDRPLTEKELLNAQKQRLMRQQFVEYLLKQVAELTYQYNCFENGSLLAFVTVRYPVIHAAGNLLDRHCPHSRVYVAVGCPSVRPSVCPINRPLQQRAAGLLLGAPRAGDIDRQRRAPGSTASSSKAISSKCERAVSQD